MAVVNSFSTALTNKNNGLTTPAHSSIGKVKRIHFDALPTAGDVNSTVAILDIPPGKYRFDRFTSRLYHSAFGTGRTLDVGWDAYTNEDGTPVAASEAGLTAAADVSSAGEFSPGAALTTHPVGQKVFDSRDGVRIRCKVEGAALSAGEEVSGFMDFGE